MAGVDTILNEILQEAGTEADGILKEGMAKADEIKAGARQSYETEAAGAQKKALAAAADYADRIKSSCQMTRRQVILKTKQEIIDEVIEKAYQKLAAQDTDAYFQMITGLLKKNVHEGDGEICFSAADLKRLPEGYGQIAAAAAAEKKGTLRISPEPVDIDNGFILKYGGIEENCTLKALFAEKNEILRDKVNQVLW